MLISSARRLTGTPVRLHLYPAQGFLYPTGVPDCQIIHHPYAQEWLTGTECVDLLFFLKTSVDQIAEIVCQDSLRLTPALKLSSVLRLIERRIGDCWRQVRSQQLAG